MVLVESAFVGVCEVLDDREGHDVQGEILAVADGLYLWLDLIVVGLGIRHNDVEGDDRVSTCDFR